MNLEPVDTVSDALPSYRDLIVASHREAAMRHLSDVQQLSAACYAVVSVAPMNGPALLSLSQSLLASHDAFRAAAISMSHADHAKGFA